MPDWIEKAAEALKREKERQQKNAELDRARQAAETMNCPEALDKLAEAAERDIVLFNKHFPEADRKLGELERIGYTVFQIIRTRSPYYRLAVSCDENLLKFRVEQEVGGKLLPTEGFFRTIVDHDNQLRLLKDGQVTSYEDASKKLIEYALQGLE